MEFVTANNSHNLHIIHTHLSTHSLTHSLSGVPQEYTPYIIRSTLEYTPYTGLTYYLKMADSNVP